MRVIDMSVKPPLTIQLDDLEAMQILQDLQKQDENDGVLTATGKFIDILVKYVSVK